MKVSRHFWGMSWYICCSTWNSITVLSSSYTCTLGTYQNTSKEIKKQEKIRLLIDEDRRARANLSRSLAWRFQTEFEDSNTGYR
jgi:hypothetical protein